MSDIILFLHPTFGVLGIMASLWVFAETLNATEANRRRIWAGGVAVAVFLALTWAFGGYWYTHFYHTDKALIGTGPWPWAHSFFMETKEHLFFMPLILALYLPFVTRLKLDRNRNARFMALAVTGLIILNGLAIEGAGAIISHGAKLALAAHVGA
jgi:hypothetical protein